MPYVTVHAGTHLGSERSYRTAGFGTDDDAYRQLAEAGDRPGGRSHEQSLRAVELDKARTITRQAYATPLAWSTVRSRGVERRQHMPQYPAQVRKAIQSFLHRWPDPDERTGPTLEGAARGQLLAKDILDLMQSLPADEARPLGPLLAVGVSNLHDRLKDEFL